MTKRFGFTLAEVLITLGIIGVVAAMTIPTLMNQTGQAEFKTGFKKMISTLNQAVTMNVALDSTDFTALTATTTGSTDASPYALFTNRMNIIRSATDSAGLSGTGSLMTSTANANYTLFFNDGMALSFSQTQTACGTTAATGCKALVDVNGTKKPNKTSTGTSTTSTVYDQFGIIMYGQQVVPGNEAGRLIMYR